MNEQAQSPGWSTGEIATLRQSFGGWARDYHRLRPGYPDTAFAFLAALAHRVSGAKRAPDCLDLGAGTGMLAAGLIRRGLEVVGVEPDDRMRAVLAEVVGPDNALAGTAEAIPLADDSVDLVTAGQMWHWVDQAQAVTEVARVLRPGGALCICWTLRDDRVSWVADLAARVGLTDLYLSSTTDRPVDLPAPFGAAELAEFEFGLAMDATELVDQLGTFATVAMRDGPSRLAMAQEFLAANPATARQFVAPFVCKIFTALPQ